MRIYSPRKVCLKKALTGVFLKRKMQEYKSLKEKVGFEGAIKNVIEEAYGE